jgi:phosphate starvation-inducible membrane PsiE
MSSEPSTFTLEHAGPDAKPPDWLSKLGLGAMAWIRLLLLATVGLLTLWAAVVGLIDIVRAGRATISDVLLMFIYLEIWMMIAIEATTKKLPVNFIVYIAITVLTRHLVGVAGDKSTTDIGLLVDAAAILILAIAAVLIEYASHKLRDQHPQ